MTTPPDPEAAAISRILAAAARAVAPELQEDPGEVTLRGRVGQIEDMVRFERERAREGK